MKPIIKKSDYATIKALMEQLSPSEKTKELGALQTELHRATVMDDREFPGDLIQLESYFEIRDLQSGKTFCYTLTVPKRANLSEKRLSIFSPLGVALIGFRQGKSFSWEMPGGLRKFVIEKVSQTVPENV